MSMRGVFKSALECAAGQWCGEWRGGLLRLSRGLRRLRRGRIGRRRGGSPAHDLLRLWSRRRGGSRALFLRCSLGIGCGSRRGGSACALLAFALGFRAAFQLRLFGGLSSGCRSCRSILLLPLLDAALVQVLRHALLQPWHTLREDGLALAWQFFLCIEPVEQVRRIEVAKAGAAAGQRARQRDDDGGGNETLRAHGRFSTQLLATGGSKACSASARERRLAGVSPSLAIMSSHCRVAAASLARHADSASSSRAV